MFSFWKKHNDDNTPRRAILEFINKATPKESPAAEETISADKEPLLSQDFTPKSGTQGSQLSTTKRKLNEEPPENEELKEKIASLADVVETDTLLGISDIPSEMDSPIINLPKRPNLENRRRVSISAFKDVIEKNKTQNNEPISDQLSLSDASIPSLPMSPVTKIPVKSKNDPKKRVSTTAYRHAIQQNKNLLDDAKEHGSGTNTTNLSQEEPPSLTNSMIKDNVSIVAFKDEIKQGENLKAYPVEDTVEQGSNPISSSNPSSSKIQEINLQDQPEKSKNASISSLGCSPDLNVPQKPENRLKSRVSSFPSEITDEKITQSEEVNPGSMEPIDEKSRILETQPVEGEETVQNLSVEHVSGLEFSSLMDLSVPSSLHSPSAANFYQRPGPESKKRVSITAFKEALEKRKQSVATAERTIRNHPDIETSVPTISQRNPSFPMFADPLEIDNKYSELPESEINRRETALPEDFFPVASSTQMADAKILDGGEMNPEPPSPPKMLSEVSLPLDLSVSNVPVGMLSLNKSSDVHRFYSRRSDRKRVSMTEFLTALSKRNIPDKDLPDSPEKQTNASASLTVSKSASSNPSTSTVSSNKTTLPGSVLADVEIVPTTDDEDLGLPQEEMNDRSSIQPESNTSRVVSVSTLSPPEFSPSGSSEDAGVVTSNSENNQLRKSLKFDSPSSKEITKLIQSLNESEDDSNVKKLSFSDEEDNLDSGSKDGVPSANMKSVRTLALGYDPAAKNSTVIAGGVSFYEPLLSLSPIIVDVKGAPATIQATPLQLTKKRSVSQSPMYMSVMQKRLAQKRKEDQLKPLMSKSASASKDQQKPLAVPEAKSIEEMSAVTERGENSKAHPESELVDLERRDTEESFASESLQPGTSSEQESVAFRNRKKSVKAAKPSRAEKSFPVKGSSSSNPAKGKSLASAPSDEVPLPIQIAREVIVDRSRDYVPLEQRLRADPVFQEKVRSQRKKMAEEAARKSAASQPPSKKRVVKRKPPEHNVASAPVNKANIRFYSQPMPISKDALDVVHNVVGEWLEFTLDQMEIFCANEGLESLDTWEDCYSMLESQGIVKNYWEYSGLCHELLTQDECSQLLPSNFPPGHYKNKRAAARK